MASKADSEKVEIHQRKPTYESSAAALEQLKKSGITKEVIRAASSR
jgi:hypothetical protein